MRKQTLRIGLVALLCLITAAATASVDIEKERKSVVKKCETVSKLITQKGLAEVKNIINNPHSEFVGAESYVYLMDLKANILAHPTQPKLIGRNLLGLKDPVTKKPFFTEMFETVNKTKNAKGWIEYHWAKPDGKGGFVLNEKGKKKPIMKRCYYVRKGNVVVFAGFYIE